MTTKFDEWAKEGLLVTFTVFDTMRSMRHWDSFTFSLLHNCFMYSHVTITNIFILSFFPKTLLREGADVQQEVLAAIVIYTIIVVVNPHVAFRINS